MTLDIEDNIHMDIEEYTYGYIWRNIRIDIDMDIEDKADPHYAPAQLPSSPGSGYSRQGSE